MVEGGGDRDDRAERRSRGERRLRSARRETRRRRSGLRRSRVAPAGAPGFDSPSPRSATPARQPPVHPLRRLQTPRRLTARRLRQRRPLPRPQSTTTAPATVVQVSVVQSPDAQSPAAQALGCPEPGCSGFGCAGFGCAGFGCAGSAARSPVVQSPATQGSAALPGSVAAASAAPVRSRRPGRGLSGLARQPRAEPRIASTRYARQRSQPATTEQRGALDRSGLSDVPGSGTRPLPRRTTVLHAPARASSADRLADVPQGHAQAGEHKPAARVMPSVVPPHAGAAPSSTTVEPHAHARASAPASTAQARATHAIVTRSAAPHSPHAHVVSRRVAVPRAASGAIAQLVRGPAYGVVPRVRRSDSPVSKAPVAHHKGRGVGSLRWLGSPHPDSRCSRPCARAPPSGHAGTPSYDGRR